MSGIREEIDLDVTAALRKVAELEAAVGKATKTNVKIDTGGVGGIASAEKELTTYESVLGRAGVSGGQLLKVNQNLASSFSGEVKAGAKEAEKGVSGLGSVVEDARGRFGKLAGEATGSLSPALGQVKGIVGEVAGAFTGAETAALGVAAGGVAVGVALGLMAVHGVSDVLRLADSVRQMQRVTGATAEDASGLVAVTAALGLDSAAAANGFFKLSQTIAKHSDVLRADGIEIVRNRKGTVDLSETLFSVADAYQKAGSGAAGNKIAFDAFGKSAQTLLPLLNLGKKQLEEFYAAAEQHHEILSQSEVDKARAYQIATHDLTESFSGMERELGIRLIPVLTAASSWFSNVLDKIDRTANAAGNIVSHHSGFLSKLGVAADAVGIVTGVGSVVTAFEWLGKGSDKATVSLGSQEKAATKVAAATGVVAPRIAQLADAMGIDLANATAKENQALDAAAAKLNAAVTPTQRLAADTGVLTNKFSTAKENVDAFSDALDAALGVYITSDEATIRVRTAVDDLTKSMHDGVQKGQTYQQFQDDVRLKTDTVTRAVLDQVQALVRDGTVSTDAASQKKALIDRLLYLAATIKGPVADQLRAYAYRVANLPDEKVTHIDADTKPATDKIKAAAKTATDGGKEVGDNFVRSIAAGMAAGEKVLESAGEKAGLVVKGGTLASLHISSPSKVGIEIGGYFVQGIALGITQSQTLAYDAAYAQAHGLTDVYKKAAEVTADEGKAIFAALDDVRDAQTRLNYIEHDRYATSEQLARARLDVASAEQKVNDATFAALDSTQALTDATARQAAAAHQAADAYGSMLGAYDATLGVRSAQRSLTDANKALTDAQSRQAQLPGEIAAAEQDLASKRAAAAAITATEALAIVRARQSVTDAESRLQAAQDSGTASADDLEAATLEVQVAQESLTKATSDATAPTQDVTDAERTLADLRTEAAGIAVKVRDATEGVTDAQLGLVGAEKNLVDAGAALTGTQDGMTTFFRALGTAAGLTKDQIDALISSIDKATAIAANVAPIGTGGKPGTTPGSQLVTVPGGGQVTQDFATWFAQQPKSVQDSLVALGPGYNQAINTPNISAGYNPAAGQYGNGVTGTPGIDPSLVASIVAGLGKSGLAVPTSTKQVNVTVNPKTAVYDAKATAATVRIAELLS